ncbi:hypothetical protein BO86DRAFT_376815 [Aspergillus japonicus CBS 114.51]|uniref:Uncharacterized protein n=1 Tax=Aspergillus japonicus CBS 114.51 TaxID=1448312 RepID=A0A8T8X9B6_ASPJA|nr:hypothetical protein BO86DRAFT_376815 [Aspergillus japonicus CBS 114.51]RAH84615.1 hypothetical protein BO86DRAFT_376815 [Aspergillus japonicus CBS 114.51]
MPHQFESGHVLVAPIDLESRKTPEERASESAAILKHPRHAESIHWRGCLNKSVDLVEQVTRYLHAHGMTFFVVCCAYWHLENQWKMLVDFGKTGLPAAARGEILARFLGPETPLEIDLALELRKEARAGERAIAHWERRRVYSYRTRLVMGGGGRARVVERDGEVLLRTRELESESPEGSATGSMAKWLRAFWPPSMRRKNNSGLPLEVAWAKMRLPGKIKNLLTDLPALDEPVRFIPELESRRRSTPSIFSQQTVRALDPLQPRGILP